MRVRKRELFLIVGILCIGIIVMLLLMMSNKKLVEIDVNNDIMYTFIGEEKINVDGKLVYNHDDETTKLETFGEKLSFGSIPLYYQDKEGLIFLKNMNSVNIYTGTQSKVPYYTQVTYANGDYFYSINNKKAKIANTFVYDGNDLYVFFDEVNIISSNYKETLPALSYVEYNYNKELYIFNYDKKTVEKKEDIEDLKVEIGSAVIDLKSDSIESENFNRILIKNFNNLKTVTME